MAMLGIDALVRRVLAVDGKSYGAYKSIKGTYEGAGFRLHIDHVQGDPFAEPSRLRLEVAQTAPPEGPAIRNC